MKAPATRAAFSAAAVLVVAALVAGCAGDDTSAPPSNSHGSGPQSVDARFAGQQSPARFAGGGDVTVSAETVYASAPFIDQGFLTFSPKKLSAVSAFAATPALAGDVTTMSMTFRFGTSDGGSVALSASHDLDPTTGVPIRPYGVRFVSAQRSWYIAVWGAGTAQESIITTGLYPRPLAADADLTVELWIVDNWVTAILPDGQRVTADDSRVQAWAGKRAFVELYTGNGEPASVPRLAAFAASSARELPPRSSVGSG